MKSVSLTAGTVKGADHREPRPEPQQSAGSGGIPTTLLTAWPDLGTGVTMSQGRRRPLVAGNWKMNGLEGSVAELGRMIQGVGEFWGKTDGIKTDLMVCPPATLVMSFAQAARGSHIEIGAQDCHAQASGAYTGDISAEMLADAGATAVIVGHSERRSYH